MEMRVLLLADDCNPEWPSLPVVGYQMAKALSRVADITLVTHVRNRPNLEGKLRGMDVQFVDNSLHRFHFAGVRLDYWSHWLFHHFNWLFNWLRGRASCQQGSGAQDEGYVFYVTHFYFSWSLKVLLLVYFFYFFTS